MVDSNEIAGKHPNIASGLVSGFTFGIIAMVAAIVPAYGRPGGVEFIGIYAAIFAFAFVFGFLRQAFAGKKD